MRRFFEEVAIVEFGGPAERGCERLAAMRGAQYNDLSADRNSVAIVQAMEAILKRHAAGNAGTLVEVNGPRGGLVMLPRHGEPEVLHAGRV